MVKDNNLIKSKLENDSEDEFIIGNKNKNVLKNKRRRSTEISNSYKDLSSSDDDIPIKYIKKQLKSEDNFNNSNNNTNEKKKKLIRNNKPVKKKIKKESTTSTSNKKKNNKNHLNVKIKKEKEDIIIKKNKKLKVMTKTEKLDLAIKSYRWWHEDPLPEGICWKSLEHNGVQFPTPYKPHNIPLVYDGKKIYLSPQEEELATFFAAIPSDGPQLNDPTIAKMFTTNFFKAFRNIIKLNKNSNNNSNTILKFDKCDFTLIKNYLDKEKEIKKNRTKEEKEPGKIKKALELQMNGFAIMDNHVEKIGNFRIEPPGLFRGRGQHPRTGTLKSRMQPENITLNVGMNDCVPKCDIVGHAWKEVIHRDTVTWLAYWNESSLNSMKYVYLAGCSSLKGKSDMEKYEKARLLKKYINKIRSDYISGLNDNNLFIKQRSTAMWVIDVLALRVGNEKKEDEADTVGCCSLRVEHLTFNDEKKEITFSFLGKDSMPYNNTIDFLQYKDVGLRVYENFHLFTKNKKKQEDIFNELTPQELNKHLSSLMPGLSAKVFRTYNASITLQKELPSVLHNMDTAEKITKYNDANRMVAILCNHQRTAPKSFEATMGRMNEFLELLKKQRNELIIMKKKIKNNKNNIILRSDSKIVKEENSWTEAEKKENPLLKKKYLHLFHKMPTIEKIDKKLDTWQKKIRSNDLKLQDKHDNKEVALGTSKINYMDPRITVAWCKRNDVPLSGIFAKTLREKFVWAMDVEPNWEF